MRNLATLWRDTVNAYSDRVLVKWFNKKDICEKTYGEMDADITKVRKGLASLGYSASHIALIGETSPYWICCYFGIVTGDNVAVPLDANLPAEELIDLLNRSDSEALFISPKLEAVANAAKGKCPKLKNIWFLEEETEGKETMPTVMASAKDKDAKEAGEDDVVTIIFTSGTTGKSKGVVLTHRNLYDNVENVEYVGETNGTTLSVLPIHHAYCLVMDWLKTLSIGTTVCINDSFMHMIRNMSVFNPSTMLMVPMMIETIYKKLQVTKDPVSANVFGKNLKTIYTGGAHLDPFYIDEFAKYGIDVIEGYGMSECSPVISTNVKGKCKVGSIGKPLKNVEIKFENNEILVRGSSVMKEYYKMPKETEEVLKDGWLHTGDKGYLDEDGYLFINGRVKNLIILSNGENISPEEIENKLALNPLIAEVIVAGENNSLAAHIYPEMELIKMKGLSDEEVKGSIKAFIDQYNSNQPSYKQIVSTIIRTEPFARNATGKILRQSI